MNLNRLNRVIESMRAEGLSQILVSAPTSVYYLTGVRIIPGERLFALLIKENGDATLFANRLFALGTMDVGVKLVEFDDTDDSVGALCEWVNPGVLGVDKTWRCGFALQLMNARPDVKLAPGSGPVDQTRAHKDEQELAALRESSRLSDECMGRVIGMLNPGQTELDVSRFFADEAALRGDPGRTYGGLVCFGANCSEPHHESDSTILQSGDPVIIDAGLTYQGYCSDMTRTVFLHSATDEQKRVYDITLRANLAAIKLTRPGVPLREIDRAARKVIEDAGYGAYFIHRTGHGIGLEGHEPPDVSATSDAVAAPGMCFSIEPGIYLPGRFGVRVEDIVAVTPDGCEVLNALDKELVVL